MRSAAGSYYGRRLASADYRASRERKAALIYALCADRLGSARSVLDLGAGTGLITRALERLSGRPIVGLDLDRAFMEETERMAVADLLELPVADGAVDLGIANHVYEHVADLDAFFAEIGRVLAPGGAVYLTAGSKWAPIEPHYRIPTLSWWPEPVATKILRWSGRGESYDDIRFVTHGRLVQTAARHGLVLDDRTDEALATQIERYESRVGRAVGRTLRLVPGPLRRKLLAVASPQWFFFVRHAGEVG
ncbi:MAG: class I SAM-dependent methyltransferase [Gemmatimonadetes bacterium]|nr:class I SAM-dependent methyltransferase [Gemmatimonadota bacterium]